jgi:MFS family permease
MVPVLKNPLRAAGRRLADISAEPAGKAMILFTIEGILFTLVNNMINNNNNLFAMRLGASDMEISLLTTFSQIAGLIFLIPGAVMTDRLANKRRMLVISLSMLTAAYFLIGFVPAFGAYRYPAFLILMSISVCPLTIYNTSWQAYFSDVVAVEHRNRVLSKRTAGTFLAGIVISIVTGTLLASAPDTQGKILIHQIFFWVGCVLLMLQVFVITRIKNTSVGVKTVIGLKDLAKAITGLFKSKRFLGFFGVALFFYISWQIDWTLYFLGQVRYLGMNEAWLSYVSIGGTLVQFLSVGFWSKLNEKRGVRFGIIPGGLCLIGCPLAMIIGTSLPASVGPTVFLILHTIFNLTFATIPLNILQCLLQVIPEQNKTLSISIYTVFISLSNAFMPMLGVKLYSVLGGDLPAFQLTFVIICIIRVISLGLWILRWLLLRGEEQ